MEIADERGSGSKRVFKTSNGFYPIKSVPTEFGDFLEKKTQEGKQQIRQSASSGKKADGVRIIQDVYYSRRKLIQFEIKIGGTGVDPWHAPKSRG